jgi:hypothetical protein
MAFFGNYSRHKGAKAQREAQRGKGTKEQKNKGAKAQRKAQSGKGTKAQSFFFFLCARLFPLLCASIPVFFISLCA